MNGYKNTFTTRLFSVDKEVEKKWKSGKRFSFLSLVFSKKENRLKKRKKEEVIHRLVHAVEKSVHLSTRRKNG